MDVGDIVTRRSYNHDLSFVIEDIIGNRAILSGLYYRLLADASISDLEIMNTRGITDFFGWYKGGENKRENANEGDSFVGKIYPKILHIDANKHYLNQCINQYKRFELPVVGVSIEEKKQPIELLDLLLEHRPNILVVTGHDSLNKEKVNSKHIEDYLNSQFYETSVKIARSYNGNYDDLVIIAGGCKSYYEALIKAGANYASSPNRVLISITEPVNIACKIAMTSVRKILTMDQMAKEIYCGLGGFGGVETRGQSREVKPNV